MNAAILSPIRRLVVVSGLVFFTVGAHAFPASDAEMALIPSYCKDTQGFGYGDQSSNTSPRAKHWVGLMGETFWHMHHYCTGLIKKNRALKAGVRPEDRKFMIKDSINEYEYVIKNNKQHDFILLPEIYTRIGEGYIAISNSVAAEKAFAQARQLKPDYWPAYSHWAEHLIQTGKRAEAKKIVKKGLENSPSAKILIEQYRQLGGKLSEITPIQTSPEDEIGTDTATNSSTPKSD